MLYGVPLPGRHNPYVVLASRDATVSVELELEEAEQASARLEAPSDWKLSLALSSFVEEASARLEQGFRAVLRVEASGVSYPPSASLYAAATLALVQGLAEEGGYELEPGEVLRAASSIDEAAGVGLDYVDALRASMLSSSSMVYRSGEEPVPLSAGSLELELVGEEELAGDYTGGLGEPLGSALTRLLGLSVLEAVERLRREGLGDSLAVIDRLENAAYYALYGAQPPEAGCKWTPSLQRVYGVCRSGKGLGERVRFA